MEIQSIKSWNGQYTGAVEADQKINQGDETNVNQNIMQQQKQNPEYIPSIQEKALIKAIERANKKLDGGDREFEFSVHEKTKQIVVKILDKENKEVIREIPPEKILDMVASMCEMAGLFVDEKR